MAPIAAHIMAHTVVHTMANHAMVKAEVVVEMAVKIAHVIAIIQARGTGTITVAAIAQARGRGNIISRSQRCQPWTYTLPKFSQICPYREEHNPFLNAALRRTVVPAAHTGKNTK